MGEGSTDEAVLQPEAMRLERDGRDGEGAAGWGALDARSAAAVGAAAAADGRGMVDMRASVCSGGWPAPAEEGGAKLE